MKKTAVAPSNIAFTKYWGKKDEKLRIPENGSISMNLGSLLTTTTVEFKSGLLKDSVNINGKVIGDHAEKVIRHLNRIRKLAGIQDKAIVVSVNNFPSATGLSSSASGFAALTVAAAAASGLNLTEKELSILARMGSGSACRSIPDGFVEWVDGDTHETSFAKSLYPADYWDIVDVVAVVSSAPKDVPTTSGQILATSSPFYQNRLSRMKKKNSNVKKILKEKNFIAFGNLVEQEALELHAIMLTSTPPLIYLLPGTIMVMREVRKWRNEGLDVFFSLNTGQNIHVICEKKNENAVVAKLSQLSVVTKRITNEPSRGAQLIDKHLF